MIQKLIDKEQEKREERKKQTGEVFTPDWLIRHKLDISEEEWSPEKDFCDPACGDGNMIVEVIKMKIDHGSTAMESVSHTYGSDLERGNVNICKARIKYTLELLGFEVTTQILKKINSNIICGDFLNGSYSKGNTLTADYSGRKPRSRRKKKQIFSNLKLLDLPKIKND